MNTFLSTGVYTEGCIVPVTTEDPCLTILETKSDSKRWGIGFFIGEVCAENCIGLINNETDFSTLHSSILTAAVRNREGILKGSVAHRINNEFKACII